MNLFKNVYASRRACNVGFRYLSDKKLFTPGPLSTSLTVKKAMLRDLGSRDDEFIGIINYVQKKILDIAGLGSNSNYASVLMQGSGTFGVESVMQTVCKPNSTKFLIIENGAYGQRIGKMCKLLGVECQVESFPEDRSVDLNRIELLLKEGNYTNIAMVHSETTSGVLNEIEQVGKLVKKHLPESTFVVDCVSSFGAVPIDLQKSNIDFLITSSNKCIQAVPGFAIVICNKDKLLSCKGNSKSLALDLVDQYEQMEKTSQFRFTPPTHTILAFQEALHELEREGGSTARYNRYSNNHKILRDALAELGFKDLVPLKEQSKIINTFHYPNDKNFDFEEFYKRLSDKGKIIYPGKITKAPCFRIGNIGDLHAQDMHDLIDSIKEVLTDMNVKMPVK